MTQTGQWGVIRKRIIARQKQLGISRYVIANYCGVSESTIKRTLEGDSAPSVELYLLILGAVQLKSIIEEI